MQCVLNMFVSVLLLKMDTLINKQTQCLGIYVLYKVTLQLYE